MKIFDAIIEIILSLLGYVPEDCLGIVTIGRLDGANDTNGCENINK
jgi:hypothetical protein